MWMKYGHDIARAGGFDLRSASALKLDENISARCVFAGAAFLLFSASFVVEAVLMSPPLWVAVVAAVALGHARRGGAAST